MLGLFSCLFLVSFNGLEKRLGLRVGLKVLAHWFDQFIDDFGNCRLEIVGVELPLSEITSQLFV